VIRPGWNDYSEARADDPVDTVENSFTRPLLHSKELIELVNLHSDLFLGLQGHQNKLTVFGRVKYLAKIFVLDGHSLDILYKTFHGIPPVGDFNTVDN
jgi:hypothetical protein